MNDKAILGFFLGAFHCPGVFVACLASETEQGLDVERAAHKRERGMNLGAGPLIAARRVTATGSNLLFRGIAVPEGQQAAPEEQRARAKHFARDKPVAPVAMMLIPGAKHAIVLTRTVIMLEQMPDERAMGRFAGYFDLLHKQIEKSPYKALDSRPKPRDDSQG